MSDLLPLRGRGAEPGAPLLCANLHSFHVLSSPNGERLQVVAQVVQLAYRSVLQLGQLLLEAMDTELQGFTLVPAVGSDCRGW